jgi:hypothetical protein
LVSLFCVILHFMLHGPSYVTEQLPCVNCCRISDISRPVPWHVTAFSFRWLNCTRIYHLLSVFLRSSAIKVVPLKGNKFVSNFTTKFADFTVSPLRSCRYIPFIVVFVPLLTSQNSYLIKEIICISRLIFGVISLVLLRSAFCSSKWQISLFTVHFLMYKDWVSSLIITILPISLVPSTENLVSRTLVFK